MLERTRMKVTVFKIQAEIAKGELQDSETRVQIIIEEADVARA